MGLFDSIFGTAANQATTDYFDSSALGQQQAGYNQYSGANLQAQSQAQMYNNMLAQVHLYKNQPKWVLNGIDYDLQGFALALFPDDEQARLMFILKYGGV